MSEEKPLEGLRAILAVPTYGHVDPICQKSVRVAMMTATNMGLKWVGDSSPDRLPYGDARTYVAGSLMENKEDADGVMWIDSDIMVGAADIANLLKSALVYNSSFVTGVYHQREGFLWPTLYDYDREGVTYKQMANYPENAFFQVDGCGFGFCWTGLEVVEKIAASPDFDPKGKWFPDTRDAEEGFGEDLSFCHQAMNVGVQLQCNTTVQVGHSGPPVIVTREHYLAAKAQRDAAKAAKEQAEKEESNDSAE
jgi:hypothetical protein